MTHLRHQKVRLGKLRSSALLIVLFFVSLLSILAIGFLGSMRLETISTRYHAAGVKADIYADAAVSAAESQLYAATATNVPNTNVSIVSNYTNWISQPGRIYTLTSLGGNLTVTTNELSSGPDTAGSTNTNLVVDLNPQMLQTNSYLIAQPNSYMPTSTLYVQWIYQLKDGTFTTNAPTISNPPIGRFAYWVDDESAKININTAWDRNANNATNSSSPTRVSLDVVTSSSANSGLIHTYATNTAFNSVDEVGRAVSDPALATNKFSMTAYNHATDLNMFGQPRILLTTQKWLADANGTTNFLDVLVTESTAQSGSGHVDPGLLFAPPYSATATPVLDPTKTINVLNKLCTELEQTAWPFSSASLQLPYNTILPPGAASGSTPGSNIPQLALNILDYVRGVESTNQVVYPLWVNCNVTNFPAQIYLYNPGADTVTTGPRWSKGRQPLINEMGVELDSALHTANVTASVLTAAGITQPPAPNNYAWEYKGKYYARIYAPKSLATAQTSNINLSQFYWFSELTSARVGPPSASDPNGYWYGPDKGPSNGSFISSADRLSGSLSLAPGTSCILQNTAGVFWYLKFGPSTDPPPTFPQTLYIRQSLNLLGNQPTSYRMVQTPNVPVNVLNGTGTPAFAAVDDPMVCENTSDWQSESISGLTGAGLSSLSHPTTVSGAVPPQDVNSSGSVTVNFMVVPPPAGDPANPNGIVQSVAELGLVHSGCDFHAQASASSVGAVDPGVPWRTIHLQPSVSALYVPDWAIMDLFSAPLYTNNISTVNLPYVLPYSTNISSSNSPTNIIVPERGGRININAALYPFNQNPLSMNNTRPVPLAGLLNGATNFFDPSGSTSPTSLTSSSAETLAVNIINHTLAAKGQSYGVNTIYYTPGQLAEIKGVADTGEGSEALLREITSLAAVNSNVFSIYAVGQAVSMDKTTGTINVLGERRKQVIVERRVVPINGYGTTPAQPTVIFQPVFSQDLEP